MLPSRTILTYFFMTTIFIVYAKKDYFWRDYDGTIPEDALLAGRDFDGRDVHIGQAYLRAEGLIPVQINPGIRGIYAALSEAKFSKENIKILCGKPEHFSWLQTNSSTVSTELNSNNPVIGGNEDDADGANYFIGRVYVNSTICVGKVLEVEPENESWLQCVNKYGRLQKFDVYEVLVNE